jgi:uncharacterized membrane protein
VIISIVLLGLLVMRLFTGDWPVSDDTITIIMLISLFIISNYAGFAESFREAYFEQRRQKGNS